MKEESSSSTKNFEKEPSENTHSKALNTPHRKSPLAFRTSSNTSQTRKINTGKLRTMSSKIQKNGSIFKPYCAITACEVYRLLHILYTTDPYFHLLFFWVRSPGVNLLNVGVFNKRQHITSLLVHDGRLCIHFFKYRFAKIDELT